MKTKTTAEALRNFQARASSDPVKTDLELTCLLCGESVCDIEHEDTLNILVDVAIEHAATVHGDAD